MSASTLYANIITKVAATGLTAAQTILEPSSMPDTGMDRFFTVTMQSRNTNKYRDKAVVRIQHDVTISFLKRLKMSDQDGSYKIALSTEESIISAMLDVSDFASERVLYSSTSRTLNSTKEYILINILFNIEQDFSI